VVLGLRARGDGSPRAREAVATAALSDQQFGHHPVASGVTATRICRDFGVFPLVFAEQVLRTQVDSDGVQFHSVPFGAGPVAPRQCVEVRHLLDVSQGLVEIPAS
jgi:hypothetical protein